MTKTERIVKKSFTRHLGSYSQRARGYFEFMLRGHFSRKQMLTNCHNYAFHSVEYDAEKDEYVRKFHKQRAIIGCRLAKKVRRMK